jgi:hypothetical protein
VIKSHVEDGAGRNAARRRGVGGGVAEEEGWLHRKSSHGGEKRGEGGAWEAAAGWGWREGGAEAV